MHICIHSLRILEGRVVHRLKLIMIHQLLKKKKKQLIYLIDDINRQKLVII